MSRFIRYANPSPVKNNRAYAIAEWNDGYSVVMWTMDKNGNISETHNVTVVMPQHQAFVCYLHCCNSLFELDECECE